MELARKVLQYLSPTPVLPRDAVGVFILPNGEVELYLPENGVTREAASLVEAVLVALDTEEANEG